TRSRSSRSESEASMRRAVPDRTRRGGASLLAVVVFCAAIGCGRQQAPPRAVSAGGPAASAARGVAVPNVSAAPPVSEAPAVDSIPTAHYASLEAVRDTVYRLLRGCVNLADTAIHLSRDTVTFEYWYVKGIAKGFVVKAVVNDTSECPDEKLRNALMDRGWVRPRGYEADGDDGSVLGLVSRDHFCLIEGRWYSFDPTDTTYVPPPGCVVTAICIRRRADDVS